MGSFNFSLIFSLQMLPPLTFVHSQPDHDRLLTRSTLFPGCRSFEHVTLDIQELMPGLRLQFTFFWAVRTVGVVEFRILVVHVSLRPGTDTAYACTTAMKSSAMLRGFGADPRGRGGEGGWRRQNDKSLRLTTKRAQVR